MKIFKHRNIMGCIFGLMLSLPLLAVLARSAYVIVNKNAYQSYSNEYVEKYTKVTGNSQFQINNEYQVLYNASQTGSNVAFSVSETDAYKLLPSGDTRTITGLYFISETYARVNIQFSNGESYRVNYWNNITTSIYFKLGGTTNADTGNIPFGNIYLITMTTDKLDNVFEYSLDKVIQDNNFGNINFLEWFEDMFLSDNQVNNRYLHYFNWYLNYAMFVSCAYILFLVLMWFVNFARRLLERGMNYDW